MSVSSWSELNIFLWMNYLNTICYTLQYASEGMKIAVLLIYRDYNRNGMKSNCSLSYSLYRLRTHISFNFTHLKINNLHFNLVS